MRCLGSRAGYPAQWLDKCAKNSSTWTPKNSNRTGSSTGLRSRWPQTRNNGINRQANRV